MYVRIYMYHIKTISSFQNLPTPKLPTLLSNITNIDLLVNTYNTLTSNIQAVYR